MTLRLSKERSVSISRQEFYGGMLDLNGRDIPKDGKFIAGELQRGELSKSFVGGCLRLAKTRFDLSFPHANSPQV